MNINLRQPQFCNEQGLRDYNEDSIYPAPKTATSDNRLFLVCDGMGGHEDGEVASKTVTETVSGYWTANIGEPDSAQKVMNAIAASITKMEQLVKDACGDENMGTTMTLAGINADNILVAHVGDSRIYLVRPGAGIIYRSKDHSLVQSWVDEGLLTPEEARNHPRSNIVTQAIQPKSLKFLKPEVVSIKDIEDGDYLFLCTDGITEAVDDDKLVEILGSSASDSEKMKQIKQICSENSTDNYSAYLIQLDVKEH